MRGRPPAIGGGALLRRRPPAIPVPVLLYHSISDRARPNEDRWTLSPAAFAGHVDTIASSGRCALTVSQLAACQRGERMLPERPVVITFDDGYADVVGAVEKLADRGFSSTTYVTTGWVGAPGMLSRSMLGDLGLLRSVEIGAHGIHHDRLDELAGARLVEEVRGSKAELEDLLQVPVTSFAYPHGAYDRRARSAVIDADYQAAAAVKNALSHATDDPFAIARWTVTSRTSAQRISELLDGEGVPLAWDRERMRTRAARAARRLRRFAARSGRAGLR